MTPRSRLALGTALVVVAVAVFAGCASMSGGSDQDRAATLATLKASFKPRGQAGLDRLDQDDTQRFCSSYIDAPLPPSLVGNIEDINQKTIVWPADGNYLGDWKNGEKLAQEGRGKQYSDDPKGPVGGNCYACHQLTKAEIAYGTIGPSLLNFGSRGFGPEVQRYAYGKIYNAQAYSACSLMPRFGSHGILSQQQIKDLVALLMDPNSPVNKK